VNHTSHTTAAGNGGTLGPEQAAALLDQTTQQARRKFQPSPPWLLVTRAVMVLAALGAIWLTVRGQHPYRGPTGADSPILIAFIVLNFIATVGVRQRAMSGVRGRTRLRPAEIAILVAAVQILADPRKAADGLLLVVLGLPVYCIWVRPKRSINS